MIKRNFAAKDSRAEELLELVHMDVCGASACAKSRPGGT